MSVRNDLKEFKKIVFFDDETGGSADTVKHSDTFDMAQSVGETLFLLDYEKPGSGANYEVKIQGTDFPDKTGNFVDMHTFADNVAADTRSREEIYIDFNKKKEGAGRYVRAQLTCTGNTGTGVVNLICLAKGKYTSESFSSI